ncbi:MAG TPA: TrbG/VirB9 family P-type conjugative transfer protein [Bacteriovoracaceae bacterium]|nr:TrbG/VirB9 family P-type conjugative transfer protein [Bacteriovoracaceae bacterium]
MVKPILSFVLFFVFNAAWASQRVRHIEVNGDQIVTVRTSIGIATIIQVPDRPNSGVLGDQDSFKVEYLDKAITIKPLSSGARSNLYIYTDWKRFNVELVSGPQSAADYVVYLELPKTKRKSESPIVWSDFKNSLKNESLNLSIKRLGVVRNEMLLIEFAINSSKKETLKPEWIWMTQEGNVKPIHNLVLSGLNVGPSRPVTGLLQLKPSDLLLTQSIRLEMRRKKMSYLTISRANTWKR